MAIITLKCASCGAVYEALKSFSTVDESADKCPKCGGKELEKLVSGAHNFTQVNPDLMSAEEIEGYLHVKEQTEGVAADILSGQLTLDERGPKEFRPTVPEHLRKRYY